MTRRDMIERFHLKIDIDRNLFEGKMTQYYSSSHGNNFNSQKLTNPVDNLRSFKIRIKIKNKMRSSKC